MGFKVLINGELAKEFDGDHQLVDTVSLNSVQGEETSMKVSNDVSQINVIVNLRNAVESTYLDLQEMTRVRERQEAVEKASAKDVEAGRKLQQEMDDKAAKEQEEAVAAAMGIAPNEEEDARVTEPAKPTKTTEKASA